MAKAERDMTVGTPWKIILAFLGPVLFSNILQQLYSIIDTIVIGRFLGKTSLAAVGAVGSINFLIIGFCIGICMGFSIPVAQQFGAGDYSSMRRYITNGVWTLLAIGAVLTVIVTFACRWILVIMRTPAEVLDLAYDYIFIILLGIPITIAYNFLAGIIRNLGDSKSPFIILLISSVINIGFDIVSVVVLHMGIKGPAYATVLSQFFSAVMCLLLILKKFKILRIQPGEWQLDLRRCGTLCNMGLPMGLQYSLTAIGTMILQSGINSLGTEAVAAIAASFRICMFAQCPTEALGSAMSTFGGQNLGAKKLDRINQGLKASLFIGVLFGIGTLIIMLFTVRFWVSLFVSSAETTIISLASRYILTNAFSYILLVGVNVIRFTIQGLGYSNLAIIAGIMEMIARIFVGLVLIPLFGFNGACASCPVAWIMADIFLIPAYFYIMRQLRKKQQLI